MPRNAGPGVKPYFTRRWPDPALSALRQSAVAKPWARGSRENLAQFAAPLIPVNSCLRNRCEAARL